MNLKLSYSRISTTRKHFRQYHLINFDSLISTCHNDPKYPDRQVWANSLDQDQGLQCLPFCLYLFDALVNGKTKLQI